MRTFTSYESYFRTAGSDTVRGKLWSEVIDGTPNQVKDGRAGVNIMFQVSVKCHSKYYNERVLQTRPTL